VRLDVSDLGVPNSEPAALAPVDEGLLHADHLAVEVDVTPAQTEALPLPHAVEHRQPPAQVVGRPQQVGRLFDGQPRAVVLRRLGSRNTVARVLRDLPVVDRVVQRLRQDRVRLEDRGGRLPGRAHVVVQPADVLGSGRSASSRCLPSCGIRCVLM
jgi:hypothetical protein